MDWELTCALCQISGKSRKTGPLSTRDNVTVHENCLLYSSGLFCQNSPVDDDLFGFSVEDVKEEIIRGSKLMCHLCKKKGATVGCEVKRCKRSYHFPCALKHNAEKVQDLDKGIYKVYCPKHCSEGSSGKDGRPSSLNGDPDKPENLKGEISTGDKIDRKKGSGEDNVENSILTLRFEKSKPMPLCKKPMPLCKKRNGVVSGDAVAGPSSHASDSDTHSKYTSIKKPVTPCREQEVTPSCPQSAGSLKRRRILESSDSGGEADVDSAPFWRSCNQAGCTGAIFDGFIAEMTSLSNRILTDQASQEDYDVSLKVLQASGLLTKLVATQGKERERKLKEADESLAAIQKAWSILRR